jgi:hypothetical protein
VKAVSKSRLFFFAEVVVAVATVAGGIAFGADLSTQAEAWDTVRSDGFGPTVMGNHWTEYTNIEDVELSEDGRFLFIVYRTPSMVTLLSNPPQAGPDSVFRHVYGIEGGRIVLLGEQAAKVIPRQVEPERYEFKPWE